MRVKYLEVLGHRFSMGLREDRPLARSNFQDFSNKNFTDKGDT